MAATRRIHEMKLWNGEKIEIFTDLADKAFCPVCGYFILGDWPYADGKSEDGRVFASGSHEICESCHTQYGDSDFVGDYLGMTQQEVWNLLRNEWLKSVPRTPEVVEQLKNIGVDINVLH
jgi:hypothetical protein